MLTKGNGIIRRNNCDLSLTSTSKVNFWNLKFVNMPLQKKKKSLFLYGTNVKNCALVLNVFGSVATL